MYHSYISSLILLLKGLRAEGELWLVSREIQFLVTEIPDRLQEGGKKKPDCSKFRGAVEHFQAIWFKSSHFFNLSQTRGQNLTSQLLVSYLQSLIQYKLHPQGQSTGVCFPPKTQHDSSFPGTPPAMWAGSPVAWMVRILQSQTYLCNKLFPLKFV